VKNAIIQIDATAFRQWYEQRYGGQLGKKQDKEKKEEKKVSKKAKKQVDKRAKTHTLETGLKEQFAAGRLLACVTSRPGQIGRCDGYILEGKELEFYQKKLAKKR